MGHVFGQRVGLVSVYACPDEHQWNDAHKVLGACAVKFKDGSGAERLCDEFAKHHQHHANLSLEQVKKLSPPDYRTWVVVALGGRLTMSNIGHDAILIDEQTGSPTGVLMVRQGTVGESTVGQMVDILKNKLSDLEYVNGAIVGYDVADAAKTKTASVAPGLIITLLSIADLIARVSTNRKVQVRHFSSVAGCFENDADAKANGTYPQWLEDVNRRWKVMRRRIYVG